MKIKECIKDPFKYIGLETSRSLIWIIFTVVFGLFGIVFNVWAHVPAQTWYNAILTEFQVNSFYTFSIVLLASSAGTLFMKLDKDKMLWFSDIKLWLIIVLFVILFVSSFLCQGAEKLPHYNWFQLVYFIFAIIMSIYSFCVVHLDEHPDSFTHLIGKLNQEEADSLKQIIDESQKLSTDSKGLKI